MDDHSNALWESSTWTLLRGNLQEHLRFGGLEPESIPRKFSFDDREYLLQKNNLHPAKWTLDDFHPNRTLNTYASVGCKGYFRITILGKVNHVTTQCDCDIHCLLVYYLLNHCTLRFTLMYFAVLCGWYVLPGTCKRTVGGKGAFVQSCHRWHQIARFHCDAESNLSTSVRHKSGDSH